jgi:hypothetical protein
VRRKPKQTNSRETFKNNLLSQENDYTYMKLVQLLIQFFKNVARCRSLREFYEVQCSQALIYHLFWAHSNFQTLLVLAML